MNNISVTLDQFGEDIIQNNLLQLIQVHVEFVDEFIRRFCNTQFGFYHNHKKIISSYFNSNDNKYVPACELKRYSNKLRWTRDYFKYTTLEQFYYDIRIILEDDLKLVQKLILEAILIPFNKPLIEGKNIGYKYPFLNGDLSENHYIFTNNIKIEDFYKLFNFLKSNTDYTLYLHPSVYMINYHIFQSLNIQQYISNNFGAVANNLKGVVYHKNHKISVSTETWLPNNYIIMLGNFLNKKPLVTRIPERKSTLCLVSPHEYDPLRDFTLEREIGFGISDRELGAVLFLGDKNADSYEVPNLKIK